MKKLLSARRLSVVDWWRLLTFYWMLASVRVRPPREAELRRMVSASADVWVSARDAAMIERAARLIGIASRTPFQWASCLHQAVALGRWFEGKGITTQLRIGVRRPSANQIEAHAWLMTGGRCVLGGPAPDAAFMPLTTGHDVPMKQAT